MDSYSSFFSSGLLAPQRDLTATMYQCPPSPATTESCMDDSDAEMESVPTLSNLHAHEKKLTLNTNPPRLRKRKSSTTLASSPMSAIRSPMRAANVALQVQRHIPDTPSRSRSGSLSAANSIASQSTSLMGRLRSNSTGEVLRYVFCFHSFNLQLFMFSCLEQDAVVTSLVPLYLCLHSHFQNFPHLTPCSLRNFLAVVLDRTMERWPLCPTAPRAESHLPRVRTGSSVIMRARPCRASTRLMR